MVTVFSVELLDGFITARLRDSKTRTYWIYKGSHPGQSLYFPQCSNPTLQSFRSMLKSYHTTLEPEIDETSSHPTVDSASLAPQSAVDSPFIPEGAS